MRVTKSPTDTIIQILIYTYTHIRVTFPAFFFSYLKKRIFLYRKILCKRLAMRGCPIKNNFTIVYILSKESNFQIESYFLPTECKRVPIYIKCRPAKARIYRESCSWLHIKFAFAARKTLCLCLIKLIYDEEAKNANVYAGAFGDEKSHLIDR